MILVKSSEAVLHKASPSSVSEIHSLPSGLIPLAHSHHFSSWQSTTQIMSICQVCWEKSPWKKATFGIHQLAILSCNSLSLFSHLVFEGVSGIYPSFFIDLPCDSYLGCYLKDFQNPDWTRQNPEETRAWCLKSLSWLSPELVKATPQVCTCLYIHPGMETKLGEHRTGMLLLLAINGFAAAAAGAGINGLAWPCLSQSYCLGGSWQGAGSSHCQLLSSQAQSAPCPCLRALHKAARAGKNQLNCLRVAKSCRSHGPDWCLDKYFIFSHWGDKEMHFFSPQLQLVLY